MRYQDAAGWHDIDLNLVSGADGALRARSAQGGATLAARADGIVASIATPVGPIGLRHPAASAAPATATAAKATYKGALAGRDLVLTLTVGGFEETVLVSSPSAPSTYTDEFVLPAGVGARDGAGGVEFVDAKGTVLATFSNGVAFDAAPQRAGAPVTVRVAPTAPSTTPTPTAPSTSPTSSTTPTTLGTTTTTVAPAPANVATVEVAVDRAWMTDPTRVFPITVDPTYTTVATNAADPYGIDTFAWQAAPTTNYGTATALYIGNAGGAGPAEAFVKFNNLVVAPSPTTVVTESHLMLLGGSAADCTQAVDVFGIDNTLSAATVWTNRPAPVGAQVSTTTLGSGCGSAWNTFDTTTLARAWITGGAPNNGLRVTAHDQSAAAGFKWFWSGNTANPPLLYITYDRPPGSSSLVAPVDTSVLATATPTLVATTTTDPDGDTVKYWFRGTPAADAESGARVVDSGWITATPSGTTVPAGQTCATNQICFAVPPGAVSDGVTYFWHVWTADAYQYVLPVSSPWRFRADLGLGGKGPLPRDAVGPVNVNLASGNAVVSTGSPMFPTPGGAAGLSYTYNSQAPATMGLTGAYYDDPGTHVFPTTPAMVRTDPAVDFYWGTDGPGMGLSPSSFLVHWSGWITAPPGGTGTYQFAADHDDGMRIWINGVPVLNQWSNGSVTNPSALASPVTLTAGVAVPIAIDYYQASEAPPSPPCR